MVFGLKNRKFYEKMGDNHLNKIIKNTKINAYALFLVYILVICSPLFIQFFVKSLNLKDNETIIIILICDTPIILIFLCLIISYIKENNYIYTLKNYLSKSEEKIYHEELRNGEFFGERFVITEKNIFNLKSSFYLLCVIPIKNIIKIKYKYSKKKRKILGIMAITDKEKYYLPFGGKYIFANKNTVEETKNNIGKLIKDRKNSILIE